MAVSPQLHVFLNSLTCLFVSSTEAGHELQLVYIVLLNDLLVNSRDLVI